MDDKDIVIDKLWGAMAFILSQRTSFDKHTREFVYKILKDVSPQQFPENNLSEHYLRLDMEFDEAWARIEKEYLSK